MSDIFNYGYLAHGYTYSSQKRVQRQMALTTTMIEAMIVLLFVLFHSTGCSEPSCSKFPYEEQLLEKMVRMEFKVETLTNEIKAARDTVVKELNSLHEERENMKAVFGTLKHLHAQEMTLKSDEMEKTFKRQEAQIARMSEDLHNLENVTVSKLTDLAVIPTIAFKARQVADRSPATNQIIVFPTNLLNEGQGYNNGTGVFTAPVGGLYMFTVQLCNYGGHLLYFDIVVDNERQTVATMGNHANSLCHSADAVAILKPGMRTWVKFSSGSTSNVLYDSDSHYWNTFSGVLIHK